MNQNLGGEPPGILPPDEPPDKPLNEPSGINLVFCFDPNPNATNLSFCLDINAYLDTNLDNLGSGDTFECLGTDPGNGLAIIAPFKLNTGPGAELDVSGIISSINENERGTGNIDLEVDENPDTALYENPSINNVINFTTNYCAVTGLGNDYSQASITGHTQTTFSWNQVTL